MKKIINTLRERGLIEAMTSEEIENFCEKPLNVYVGFDPTADSLHIGNLVAIMGLAWFQKFGHTPIAIVGGATGMIGDPSGKSVERNLIDEATINHNLKGIQKSIENVLCLQNPKPIFLNNYEWFKDFKFIDFLRDIGKHFRLGTMLSKESVKNRINSEEGISFTEFSYQLLQAYDFLHLFDKHQVVLQMGGSDQWGNITAGIDLIRKVKERQAYGLTFPLLTRSDGKKFGKSEEGTIWLNSDKLSPYDFYQYFIRIPDADVIKLMKMLTFMDLEEIQHWEHAMQETQYNPNSAQKKLAEELTRLIHGQQALENAQKITEAVAPGSDTILTVDHLEKLSSQIPSHTMLFSDILGAKIVDVLVKCQLQSSKAEARKLIANGGLYLNNQKVEDENYCIQSKDLIEKKVALLAIGKKRKIILKIS